MADKKTPVTGLALLREPFPDHQISKLPKGTKAQNQCANNEKKNCSICGGWHHPKIIHLDYVGHAALTDRLLDADPNWHWDPVAFNAEGLPAFDKTGGLWIRLHICGHSRIGYGNAESSSFKEVGSREKEVIGDALRNAAMRFGAALDLWHKGQLHVDGVEDAETNKQVKSEWNGPLDAQALKVSVTYLVKDLHAQTDIDELKELVSAGLPVINQCQIDHKEWASKLDVLIKDKTDELKGNE